MSKKHRSPGVGEGGGTQLGARRNSPAHAFRVVVISEAHKAALLDEDDTFNIVTMTTQARLHLHVFAPALTSDDGRPLAAVEGMERALPGLRLAWRISDAGKPILLPQRAALLAETGTSGEFGLLCNGDESYPVTMDGQRLGARESPGGEPLLLVHAKLPQDESVISAAANMVEHVAEGVRAQWGVMAPGPVRSVIAAQTGPKLGGRNDNPSSRPVQDVGFAPASAASR